MLFKDFDTKKKLSVALFLTDGNMFLAVNPTGKKTLDIPKGEVEPGEGLIKTLIREIKEECLLNISKYKNDLIDMGRFRYLPYKDVHVFLLKLEELPPVSKMKCVSLFKMFDRMIPEVRGHRYLTLNDLELFKPEMRRIIKYIERKMNEA